MRGFASWKRLPFHASSHRAVAFTSGNWGEGGLGARIL
jgi:hypothetical protein